MDAAVYDFVMAMTVLCERCEPLLAYDGAKDPLRQPSTLLGIRKRE
jgi:hypothetical protein